MPRNSGSEGSCEGALVELTNREVDNVGFAALKGGQQAHGKVFAGMVFAFAGRFSAAQTALKRCVSLHMCVHDACVYICA